MLMLRSSHRLFGDHHFPIICLRRQRLLLSVRSGPVLLSLALGILIGNAVTAAPPSPSSSPSKSSRTSSTSEPASSGDRKFYRNSEERILQTLEAFEDSELSKEVKLTRIKRSNGTNFFYPYGKTDKPYFSWTPGKGAKTGNGTSSGLSVNSLVLGMPQGGQSPFGWMNGAFIALRKYNSTSKANQTHYYAMVVYARKDEDGMVLEWDRWSVNMGKAMESRRAFVKSIDAISSITQDTILCAYGTCACKACKGCNQRKKAVKPKVEPPPPDDEDDDEDEESAEEERDISFGSMNPFISNSRGYNMALIRNAEMIWNSNRARMGKDGNSNAYATSVSKGKGNAKAVASSSKGSSVAQSTALNKGSSTAVSKGQLDSVAESNAQGGGSAKAMSMSNQGFAQSSSQASGPGEIQSMAGKTGKNLKDYQNYDDLEVDDDKDDILEATNLFQETDQAFDLAEKRSSFVRMVAKGDIGPEMCSKEPEMAAEMDKLELAAMMKDSGDDQDAGKTGGVLAARKRALYRDPLRFGMDVDGEVNKSILLTGETSGFLIKREQCCQLNPSKKDADIMELLQNMGQHCGGLLQELVSRLETFKAEHVKKLMQTKKLSPTQHHDLVPMTLLRNFMDQNDLAETMAVIKELFSNSTGEKVTVTSALMVNSAHYAVKTLKPHKIKVLKGLVENAQSVWTGVLLEYKYCTGGKSGGGKGGGGKKSKECSTEYKERLESEMNLALGTYLFLKYADARFSAQQGDGEETDRPGDTFVGFLKLHNLNIAKQVYCKSKRMVGGKQKE